jgi:hypothetical protein
MISRRALWQLLRCKARASPAVHKGKLVGAKPPRLDGP